MGREQKGLAAGNQKSGDDGGLFNTKTRKSVKESSEAPASEPCQRIKRSARKEDSRKIFLVHLLNACQSLTGGTTAEEKIKRRRAGKERTGLHDASHPTQQTRLKEEVESVEDRGPRNQGRVGSGPRSCTSFRGGQTNQQGALKSDELAATGGSCCEE